MDCIESLLEHKRGCTICDANPVGTALRNLKLCETGNSLRARCIADAGTGLVIRALYVLMLLAAGCALVSTKFGSDAAIGIALIVLSMRIQVSK